MNMNKNYVPDCGTDNCNCNRTLGKSDVTVYHMSAGVQHY